MNHPCNTYILKALEMTNALMDIANKGEVTSDDDACRILFAIMRDCAYKIRKQAQCQYHVHKAAGDRTIN